MALAVTLNRPQWLVSVEIEAIQLVGFKQNADCIWFAMHVQFVRHFFG